MSHFEYLITFVSFVFAIVVSRILVTLAELEFKKISWLHVGWLVVLALNIFQMWWLRWSWNDELGYNYFDYLVFLAPALVLVFTVAVLTPSDEPEDWSEFMKSKRIPYFVSYGLFWLSILGNHLHYGGYWKGAVAPIILCALGAVFSNRYFQYLLLVFFASVFVLRAYLLGIGEWQIIQ